VLEVLWRSGLEELKALAEAEEAGHRWLMPTDPLRPQDG
jgi:hypothetical protein